MDNDKNYSNPNIKTLLLSLLTNSKIDDLPIVFGGFPEAGYRAKIAELLT